VDKLLFQVMRGIINFRQRKEQPGSNPHTCAHVCTQARKECRRKFHPLKNCEESLKERCVLCQMFIMGCKVKNSISLGHYEFT